MEEVDDDDFDMEYMEEDKYTNEDPDAPEDPDSQEN